MESIQFIFWLYMENVCVYHVSSSCLRVSAAFSLTIVLFVEQLCALRLTCASSLRFNQGFCMEWIKYQHNEVIISQKPPPTFCILLYIQFFKVGKGWIKHDVVKMNPEPFKIQDLNIVNCVSLTSDLISSSGLKVRRILKCKRKHVIIKAKRGILSLKRNLCILNEQCMAQLENFDSHGWCHHMCVSLGKRRDYFYKEGGLSKVMSALSALFPNLQG